MKKLSSSVLSVLLWFFGGTVYFLLEVAYKYATGNPQRISWVMLVLAIVLTIPKVQLQYINIKTRHFICLH